MLCTLHMRCCRSMLVLACARDVHVFARKDVLCGMLHPPPPSPLHRPHARLQAVGNGLTDPAIQYGAYSDYALLNGLIGEGLASKLKLVS